MAGNDTREKSDPIQRLIPEYADEPRPLASYLTLIGTFNAIFAGFLLLLKSRRQSLPGQISVFDVVLLGVATHKVSRLLAKDSISSPLRAPFAEYEGPSDLPSEVDEGARGRGMRHAIGELITCPYCTSQWVAAFFTYGLMLWPRLTRLVGAIFAVVTISDLLNRAYETTMETSMKAPEALEQKMETEAARGD
jgi:hypothetical protein